MLAGPSVPISEGRMSRGCVQSEEKFSKSLQSVQLNQFSGNCFRRAVFFEKIFSKVEKTIHVFAMFTFPIIFIALKNDSLPNK